MRITILTRQGENLTFDLSNIKNKQVLNDCIDKLQQQKDINENDFLGSFFGTLSGYEVIKIENGKGGKMKKEFLMSFQLSKLIIFNVNYYTLGSNKTPHFSTSADEFCRSKKDFSRCGQAQDSLLPKNSIAIKFYKKWDSKHLQDLTLEEYQEMIKDLEQLKVRYNFIEETPSQYHDHISFYDLVEFSKQTPKGVK